MRNIFNGMAVTLLLTGMASAADLPVPSTDFPRPPKGPMTFFLTSQGSGKGADLGGLAGADAHCQKLATDAGAGQFTWHASLSTDGRDGKPIVNARDRIGKGPWRNAKSAVIAKSVSDLHGDTVAEGRNGNLLNKATALSERGELIPGEGDKPNKHDVLTGTQQDGRAYKDKYDHTCSTWTNGSDKGSAQLGHFDRLSSFTSMSWNSAHPSTGCSEEKLAATGSGGLFYCFAVDGK